MFTDPQTGFLKVNEQPNLSSDEITVFLEKFMVPLPEAQNEIIAPKYVLKII